MRTRFVLALLTVAMATSVAAQSSLQTQADAAYAKLQAVMRAVGQAAKAPVRRTVFSQTEMNAYLRFRANTWLPTGITNRACSSSAATASPRSSPPISTACGRRAPAAGSIPRRI
jgi:hypothetical protein